MPFASVMQMIRNVTFLSAEGLIAHLLSAIWGYRLSGVMPEGAYVPPPEDKALHMEHIYVQTDAQC